MIGFSARNRGPFTVTDDSTPFIPGQRWLSDGESELGLGVIAECDGRAVNVAFPATGESRIYAVRNAPLTRVVFEEGDHIQDREGRTLEVMEALTQEGLVTYLCEDEVGSAVTLTEAELDDHLRLNRPEARLLAGRLDRHEWFNLRYETWLRGAKDAHSPVAGLVGARVSPIPHQLYIASQVSSRLAPRVLLADEVGLGKTIEAGLILHRLLQAGRGRRVLVVVPEPLLHQWLVEMLRRFNLAFSLFDRDRFDAAVEEVEEGGNPFHGTQRVLCSLEFLISDPAVARAALGGEWDLLVVDEAHHLAWSPEESSLEYDLTEALAEQSVGVLLLTATPEQLGRAGHFGRLRLLDPQRFHDYDAFLAEEQAYEPVAAMAGKLMAGEPLGDAEHAQLNELLGEEAEGASEEVIDRLVDRHGTGRVLFRNTRQAIQGFPERIPTGYPLPYPDEYREVAADPLSLLTPELAFGPGWSDIDPRVDWLADKLRELRPEKVLVICADPNTVIDLSDALRINDGIHAAVFHEGMEIVERDRAAAYFADTIDGAQVLICSEIGSEGRNFQFAHHLVLFDLPQEPELLEQRIGRLDRIGQREAIQIHVPYLQGGAEEVLYHWYADGLGLFERVCPAAPAVFEALCEELLAAMANPAEVGAVVARAKELTARLNQNLEAGRDRLLELHSHRPEASEALVAAVAEQDRDRELVGYMNRYWDSFGVEHEPGSGGSTVLHPGNHMLHHHFPGLPEEGTTVTFDRHDALAHEDREFLTWEHPMVRGAMEQLTGTDLGSSVMTLVKDRRIKAGSMLLELVYVAECAAPPELEIGRFLPPTALHLMLDQQGREISAQFPYGSLRGECMRRNRDLTKAVVESQAKLLKLLLERGELYAQRAAKGMEAAAAEQAEALLGAELERLRALGSSVRDEELEMLKARRAAVADYLEHTHLRLDAVRLIIAK